MALCATSLAFASDFVVDGIHYNRMSYYDEESGSYNVSDSLVTVSQYEDDKYTGDIVIPDTINVDNHKYIVRTIGGYAFHQCEEVTSVQLPETITAIDGSAFQNCRNLSTINLPDSIQYIGGLAFGWSGLTEVTLPQNLKSIQTYTFSNCYSLGKVVFPEGLTEIGERAFEWCNLSEVIIPQSVTSIGEYAFQYCGYLSHLELTDSLKSISAGAFSGCYNLRSLTIPASVEKIGNYAFQGPTFTDVTSLNPVPPTIGSETFSTSEKLKVPNADAYRNDAKWNAAFQRIVELPIESEGSSIAIISKSNHTCSLERLAAQETTAIRIPESVMIDGEEYAIVALGDDVLSDNTGVETLVIPGSFDSVPTTMFASLNKLKELTFEDSETALDLGSSRYYENCPFESVYLGRDITYTSGESYYDEANGTWKTYYSPFAGKETLTEVKIGQTVTNLNDYLFYECKFLSTFEGGENVETIGTSAFNDCDALISVQLNNAKTIGRDAFHDCDALSTVEATAVETVGYEAFEGCDVLTSATFGDNLKKIDTWAFNGCSKLENIKVGNSLETIGGWAFQSCSTMRQIDIPETVTEIGEYAFNCCQGLSGLLTIPTGIKTVNANAFSSTGYTVCELPNTEFVKLNGTDRIGNVETIIVPSDLANTYRDSNWGEMYDFVSNSGITVSVEVTTPGNLAKDIVTQARKAPASVNKLIITGGQLNQDDFNVMKSNMTACFEIDMSAADCADIYENAFNGKQVVKSIVLPNNATSIGQSAFEGCTILDSVFASDNMKKVADGAFRNCMALKKVDLGDNVSEIGSNAFYNAYKLNDLRVPSALTTIGDYAFYNACKLDSLTLGEKVRSIGSYAFGNCNSLAAFSMPNTVTSLGEGVLSNTAITDIDLSEFNYLTAIPNSMFNGSLQLQSVVFPKNVSSIGSYSFQGCIKLEDVNLKETLLSKIGESAFSGCTKLASITLPESTTDIADGAFSACRKLRTINVSAVTPPSVYKNTFKNVANEVCTVSIPTDSFFDYLLAQYWGSFVDLKCEFDMLQEDDDVEVAFEVFDSEKEAEVEVDGEDVDSTAARCARRAPAKVASSNTLADGVSLFVNAAKTVRFHFDVNGDKEISQVLLNGEDVLDRVVNGYLVLSEFGEVNTLQVVTKAKDNGTTGISDAVVAGKITANSVVDVYNMSGVQVLKGVEMGSISGLNAGIYIVRTADAVKKIVIR